MLEALAELNNGKLGALIDGTNTVSQGAPALLAWIEGACDRELNRRRLTAATAGRGEGAVSIDATTAMRAKSERDDRAETRGVAALLDAVVNRLGGGGQRTSGGRATKRRHRR